MKSKVFRALLLTSFLFCLMILIFASTAILSNEDYMMMLKKKYHLKQTKYTIKKIYTNPSIPEEGGTTPATDGTGLNLMLIDYLQESYAKDILTCLRNSEEGKYDDYLIKLTVEASCGLSNAETSTYPGTALIKSYLPYNNGGPVWNRPYGTATANEMTLEQFDNTVAAKAGYYDGFGISLTSFQYDTWASRGVKSKINGAGNASRTNGDYFYYPDVLATNNNYITSFVQNYLYLNNVAQEDLSNTWLSFMYAMAHNRGESGALNYMFGCRYNAGNTYKSVNSADASVIYDVSNSVVSLYTDYRSTYPNAYGIANYPIDSGSMTIPAALLAVWNDEWYISDTMATHLINNITTCVDYWNVLFPNEIVTTNSLTTLINNSVATYSEAIRATTGKVISPSECAIVYGTNDADALDVWGYSYNGVIFKVTDIPYSGYHNTYSDGSTPYVIHAMDVICAREAISACFGDIIYAKMLVYAGLANVDPTNPNTYYTNPNSLVPTGDLAWMKAYGVNTMSLTTNRKNLLQTAYNITQLPNCTYCHWEVGNQLAIMNEEYTNNSTPTELECACYVCRVYRDTGYYGFEQRMTCGGFLFNNGNIWECIKPEEMEPGDIMVYVSSDGARGHIMIYLSGNVYAGGPVNCTVMESNIIINTQFNRDGPNIRTVPGTYNFAVDTEPKSNDEYYCFRLRAIDTTNTTIGIY